MQNYLDTGKSVIISSPAGSGKTEKLARRYIALVRAGAEVERILAITFTDKAAAEMKQRILRILRDEDEELFHKLLQKMPLMRVSTIHSFCGTLIRRFSFEASIDPNYRIEDAVDSRILWEGILYEVLMRAGKGMEGREFLLRSLSERGFRGIEHLKDIINSLFEKMPFSSEAEIANPVLSTFDSPLSKGGIRGVNGRFGGLIEVLRQWPGAKEAVQDYESLFESDAFNRLVSVQDYFLTTGKSPRTRVPAQLKGIADYKNWALGMFRYWEHRNIEEFTARTGRIQEVFKKCLGQYRDKKNSKGILDFSDLEYLAYKLLTGSPEWSNVLYAFDEKTDHILVDEFQDTNTFQWAIIDRLTEEWRSGAGAKREEGITPTIFLVGDEKQSIYFFRGANVEIFHNAREKLKNWLKEEFTYEEVKENYRSLPAIIDFTNQVFSEVMKAEVGASPWVTRYNPFAACRDDAHGRGKVEIILLDDREESAADLRKREAVLIAKRIRALINDFPVTDMPAAGAGGIQRQCRYMDIALLLRKRTHLKIYEETFRQYGIPFVAVKGIGFYQEPEIAMLRAVVLFIADPKDDYSLYVLLKSPFFMVEESMIIKAVNAEGDCLFAKLKNILNGSNRLNGLNSLNSSLNFLQEWLLQIANTPLSELIEKTLVQTGAWEYFYEPQRKANLKKFIQLVEDMEANGKSLIKIKNFLEQTISKADEPKANVNTEGMDAVRIMTVHGSKGLEFPVVFVPGLDESFFSGTDSCIVFESDGRLFLKYLPEASLRKLDGDFRIQGLKEEEEQKRLFYVAVTRAKEGLFLTGQWKERRKCFLDFLIRGLGLKKTGTGYRTSASGNGELQGLSVLSETEAEALHKEIPRSKIKESLPPPMEFLPLEFAESFSWKTVTEVADIRRRHGEYWMLIGDVMHRLFEGVSKGIISEADMIKRAEKLLSDKGMKQGQMEKFLIIIDKDITILKEKGIWQDIILPREGSFSELPFVLEVENPPNSELRAPNSVIYTGRIDRIIQEKNTYKVYDYKTFPVEEKEIEYLLKEYSFQLNLYRKAVKEIFKAKDVRSFIVFTHTGDVREVR